MLEIPEFKSKTWWVNVAFEVDCCYRNQGVTKLYSFKESKFHYIFLICGHMAQNPYFPADRKMCLMGDIQVSIKFSMSNDVHLLRRGIRILTHTLFEILIFQWLKILPFGFYHTIKFSSERIMITVKIVRRDPQNTFHVYHRRLSWWVDLWKIQKTIKIYIFHPVDPPVARMEIQWSPSNPRLNLPPLIIYPQVCWDWRRCPKASMNSDFVFVRPAWKQECMTSTLICNLIIV